MCNLSNIKNPGDYITYTAKNVIWPYDLDVAELIIDTLNIDDIDDDGNVNTKQFPLENNITINTSTLATNNKYSIDITIWMDSIDHMLRASMYINQLDNTFINTDTTFEDYDENAYDGNTKYTTDGTLCFITDTNQIMYGGTKYGDHTKYKYIDGFTLRYTSEKYYIGAQEQDFFSPVSDFIYANPGDCIIYISAWDDNIYEINEDTTPDKRTISISGIYDAVANVTIDLYSNIILDRSVIIANDNGGIGVEIIVFMDNSHTLRSMATLYQNDISNRFQFYTREEYEQYRTRVNYIMDDVIYFITDENIIIANNVEYGGSTNTAPTVITSLAGNNSFYMEGDLGYVDINTIDDFCDSYGLGSDIRKDIYVGCHFTAEYNTGYINEFYIAGFDYEYNPNDNYGVGKTPHVIVIPNEFITTTCMNLEKTTEGGYYDSYMNQYVLPEIDTKLQNIFGSHLLQCRNTLTSGIDSSMTNYNYPSKVGVPNQEVFAKYYSILMSEIEVYGTRYFSCNNGSYTSLYTLEKQLPIFYYNSRIFGDYNYVTWLRDISSTTSFCVFSNGLEPNSYVAYDYAGVLPRFALG